MSDCYPTARAFVHAIELYLPNDGELPPQMPIVRLCTNESLWGPNPLAIAAARLALDATQFYPDSSAQITREAIAERYAVPASHLVCEAGSEPLIYALLRAYAGPGDEVIIPQYAFIAARLAIDAAEATAVVAAEPNYAVSVDEVLAKQTFRTRVVYLANPNNPTGTWLARDELHRLRRLLRPDVLLIIDAAYADFLNDPSYTDGGELVSDAAPNTVVLHTCSKLHGLAGLRLGWCYAPASIAGVLHRLRGLFTVSTVAQAAAAASILDTAFIERVREQTATERIWITNACADAGLHVIPSAGNFINVGFGSPERARRAHAALREQGLLVRMLDEYAMQERLRISVGLREHNERVIKILHEIAS